MDLFTLHWLRPVRWACLLGLACGAPVVLAQDANSATAPKLTYRSVMNQYQGFREQPVSPWQKTNEVVEKIGGWRVYAKEARIPDAPGKPVTHSEAETGTTDRHAGHGRTP